MSDHDLMVHLQHELQVHHIELEMQNEELQTAYYELEQNRDRYQHLYDYAPVGYITISEKGLITECNLTACQMLKKGKAQLINQRFGKFITKDYESKYYEHRRQLQLNAPPLAAELEIQCADEKCIFIKLDSQFVNADGNPEYHMVMSDITIRKNLEIMLKEQEQRILDYKLQRAQYSRINAAGDLVTAIAHEVNQPLMSAVNYIGGCLVHLKEQQIPEQILQMLQNAMQQAEKAGQIIHGLKEFIRKGTLVKVSLDLNNLIREIIECFAIDLVAHEVSVQLRLDNELPPIFADKLQMMQVLTNIMQNAIDAMVSAKTPAPRQLKIKTYQELEHKIAIEIIDNGPGIPAAIIDQIFTPFFTTKPDGIGLGLAMAYSLIAAHRGNISVYIDGTGTKFKITLPNMESSSDAKDDDLHHR